VDSSNKSAKAQELPEHKKGTVEIVLPHKEYFPSFPILPLPLTVKFLLTSQSTEEKTLPQFF